MQKDVDSGETEHVFMLKERVRTPEKEEIAGGASSGESWETGCWPCQGFQLLSCSQI